MEKVLIKTGKIQDSQKYNYRLPSYNKIPVFIFVLNKVVQIIDFFYM